MGYDKKAVKDYHDKLTNITIRIPSAKACGIDYKEKIKVVLKERAKESGDKELSINEYILELIEKDSGISIPRGLKEMKKKD